MISQTVWKFPFQLARRVTLEMPVGAMPLHVDEQADQPCLWALVDPFAEKCERTFYVFGTGHSMPALPLFHIATWQSLGGVFVWHMFEEVEA